MKKLICLLALSTLSFAQAQEKVNGDTLLYTCANLEMSASTEAVRSHADNLKIYAKLKKIDGKIKIVGKIKVQGNGELERVNALENQGLFDQVKVSGGFGLKNSYGDKVTIMEDSDGMSSGGEAVISGQKFSLQCAE